MSDICRGIKADGNACKNKSKEYGVCGKHRKFSCINNDPKLNEDLIEYISAVKGYFNEANILKSNGINILSIQQYFNYNLCSDPVGVPDVFVKVINHLLKQGELNLQLQTKYDPNLVCNICDKILHYHGHLMQGMSPCDCQICSYPYSGFTYA